jgi:hypothetical protein
MKISFGLNVQAKKSYKKMDHQSFFGAIITTRLQTSWKKIIVCKKKF